MTTSFGADNRGNLSSSTDARSNTTLFSTQWGRVSSIQTPQYTISRTINIDGTVGSETRRGFTTSFSYDALERITQTAPPVGNAINTTYDNSSGLSFRVARGSSSVTTSLDGFGRTSGTQNSVGVQTDFTRDACGRRTYESYPFTSSNIGTSIQYDDLSRVTRKTNPDNTNTTFSYSGLNVTITDENNHTTQQTWSAFGDPGEARLSSVTDASGLTTTYGYNALGTLISVSQPGVNPRSWTYNTKNQLISETHPESGTVSYVRDAVGNITQRVDAKSQITNYTYDSNNRLTQFDPPGDLYNTQIAYDASDNRTSVVNGVVSTSYGFDGANRLTSRTDTISGRPFGVTIAYDGNDNIASVQYPSGRVVTYAYDSENRFTSVAEGATTYANTFSYHPSGAITSFRAGNGLTQSTTFDNRYRVQSLNAGGVLSLAYGYDSTGNVLSINESTRSGMNQTFGYDALDRLTTANGPWGGGSFSYDSPGNRLSKVIGNAGVSYSYDSGHNRLTGASGAGGGGFQYDANGNQSSDPAGTYTHTPDNMMETATVAGTTTTYRYDADNVRVLTLGAGPATSYVHGQRGVLLAEYQESCPGQVQLVRDYVYAGDRLMAAVKPPVRTVTISMTASGAMVSESVGSASLGVRLTTSDGLPLSCAVSVQYGTTDGTAVAGKDYTATSGTLTFAGASASGTTQTIAVPVTHDALNEDPETFTLALSHPVGALLGTASEALTILDDAPLPSLAIGNVSMTEGNSGSTNALFTVRSHR